MSGLVARSAHRCALAIAVATLFLASPDPGAAQQAGGTQVQQGGNDARSGGEGRARRGRDGPAAVHVDAVQMVPMTQTIPVLGRLVPRQTSIIAARTAGPIELMNVHVGDRVKQGDVLATLVSEQIRWRHELRESEVAQYKASIRAARAELAKADNEMRRMTDLQKSAAFSKARYEDQLRVVESARATLEKSMAELRQAEANLKLAEIELKYAEVRAPFAGVVTQRHTQEGAWVQVGGPVVTLLNDAELEVEADVPTDRLGGLQRGAVIDAEIAKHPIQATVRAVVPDENPLARTRAVRFTPSAPLIEIQAAANQTVLLRIPVGGTREALSVHKDAVLQRAGGAAVFVVVDGKAQMRRVKLGEAVASRFEVLEGLQNGEMAVVRGNERLRDGQQVRPPGEGSRGGEGGGRQRNKEADE